MTIPSAKSIESNMVLNTSAEGKDVSKKTTKEYDGAAEHKAELTDVFGYGLSQSTALQKANQLADLMMKEPHRFALQGDTEMASIGVEALKALFDFSVETESLAIPPIAATLHSIFPDNDFDDSAVTGSKRKRKLQKTQSSQIKNVAHPLFDHTPLSELTIEGMSERQLWDQMELRNGKMCNLLDAMIMTEGEEEEAIDQEDEAEEDGEGDWGLTEGKVPKDEMDAKKQNKRAKVSQDGEEGEEEMVHSLDELSDAELRSLGLDPSERSEIANDEGAEFDSLEDEEDEDDEMHGYPGASDLSDDDELSGVILTEPLLTEAEQQKRKAELEAQERRQLRSQRQFARMMRGIQGGSQDDVEEDGEGSEEEEEEDEDDEDYEEEDDDDDDVENEETKRQRLILDNLDNAGGSSAHSTGKGNKRHVELDDDFFSIDQFNKDTDDYGDEGVDLGDDIDLFKSINEEEDEEDVDGEDEGQIYYKDFFGPPPFEEMKNAKKGQNLIETKRKPLGKSGESVRRIPSVRFKDEVSVLRIKARKQKAMQITPEMLQLLQQYPSPDGMDADDHEEGDEEEDDDDEEDEEDEEDDEEDLDEEESESGNESDEEGEDEEGDEDEEDEDDHDEDTRVKAGMDIDGDAFSFNKIRTDDLDEEEVEENALSDSEEEQETAKRFAGDLFADESEEEGDEGLESAQSSHQRRLNALQEEISRLESENVGKKDWTLMGEAGSRSRPENSLLEEDVEFESNRKTKPVNTPEMTSTIEDLIKRRILENQFDDVQRRATLQPLDFLPSKMLELSDQKSSRSLDQVYEDELGGVADAQGQKLDKELQNEHEEIDRLYENLESQLDALSNAHYTPKAPKVSIQTINNAPTISLEESLPSTMSHGTQLAPEEVYHAGSHNTTLEGDSTELTPEEKRKRHRQLRDEKRARNERIADHKRMVEINREAFGQNRGGRFVGKSGGGKENGKRATEEKEEALRKLMGNKGVSVIGKGENANKKAQRNSPNGQSNNAANYKL